MKAKMEDMPSDSAEIYYGTRKIYETYGIMATHSAYL